MVLSFCTCVTCKLDIECRRAQAAVAEDQTRLENEIITHTGLQDQLIEAQTQQVSMLMDAENRHFKQTEVVVQSSE